MRLKASSSAICAANLASLAISSSDFMCAAAPATTGLSHPLSPINLPILLLFSSSDASELHLTGQGYCVVHGQGLAW